MQQDDPRNIFFNQRRQFDEKQQNTQSGQTAETQNKTKQTKQNETSPQNDMQQTYEEKVAEMKRLAAKYQREGEGQLVKDIVNNVIEQKAAGKLSNEQLVTFAKRVSPMLNAEQRTRLNGLVEQLLKV